MMSDAIPAWYADAVCASIGDDFWYPEKGGSSALAKKVCATCPVVAECLEWALRNNERYGVWGGKSERERRKLEDRHCRNCGEVYEPEQTAERYCGEECRTIARRRGQDECEKALACIQCGTPATTLRCPACTKRHQVDQTMTRAQTKEAA